MGTVIRERVQVCGGREEGAVSDPLFWLPSMMTESKGLGVVLVALVSPRNPKWC